jgi:hypothetical protein
MRESSAGRKPFDAIVLFRMPVLQALNNLSDERVEIRWEIGCRSPGFSGSGLRTGGQGRAEDPARITESCIYMERKSRG